MIKSRYSYPTSYINDDWRLNGDKSPDQVLNDGWVRDSIYNAQIHEFPKRVAGGMEYLLRENAILHDRLDRLSELTYVLVSMMKENVKPSMLVHPDPEVRRLAQIDPLQLADELRVMYGVEK